MTEILKVTDATTRAEIGAMLLTLRAAQKRPPACMAETYHARYDVLLGDWLRAKG